MTQNREDYIKAVFKIAEREGEVSNQRIADRQTHFKQTPFVGKLFDDQASI